MNNRLYFQDHMHGNICFGCGKEHDTGLQIKSYWDEETAICKWKPRKEFEGWKGLMNGGIIGTLIDCHCMCTAMAAAYRDENRALHSSPTYRYATGTMTVKYLQPTPSTEILELRAKVEEIKGKKTRMSCEVWSGPTLTATAEVIALRVFDSSRSDNPKAFAN